MKRKGFVAAALVAVAVVASPIPASAGFFNSLAKHAVTGVAHKIETNAEKAVVHAIFKDFSRAVRKGQRVRGVRRGAI